jgi:hypothetical protein
MNKLYAAFWIVFAAAMAVYVAMLTWTLPAVSNAVLECTSGTHVLSLTCEDEQWVGPQGCDAPFDFCPATGSDGPSVSCEDGQWSIEGWLRHLADGLGPCPEDPPADATVCIKGGTGGIDRDHCGYPCIENSERWTVISCVAAQEEGHFEWLSDGACD